MKIESGTIIRTTVLALALVNQVLTISGYSPLPIEDPQVELVIGTGFTIVASIVAWWKDNNFTKKRLEKEQALKTLEAQAWEIK